MSHSTQRYIVRYILLLALALLLLPLPFYLAHFSGQTRGDASLSDPATSQFSPGSVLYSLALTRGGLGRWRRLFITAGQGRACGVWRSHSAFCRKCLVASRSY